MSKGVRSGASHDLFGNVVKEEAKQPKASTEPAKSRGMPAIAEVPFRPYTIVRESKTSVWCINTAQA